MFELESFLKMSNLEKTNKQTNITTTITAPESRTFKIQEPSVSKDPKDMLVITNS